MKPTMSPSIVDAVHPYGHSAKQRSKPKTNVSIPLALAVSATFKRYDEENPTLSTDDILCMTASTHNLTRSQVVDLLWGAADKSAVVAATSPIKEA